LAKKKLEGKSIELELLDMQRRLDEMEEFLVETRHVATLQTHSLPFLLHQFMQVCAQRYALRQSLVDVQKEAALRHTSFENVTRERSRLVETATRLRKYIDYALKRNREMADEITSLKEKIRILTKQVEAKQQIINSLGELQTLIKELTQQKKLPPDVMAELQTLIAEMPKQLVTPPPESEEEEEVF